MSQRTNGRPYGVQKKQNEYMNVLPRDFYANCPKSVFAAIAVSLATVGGDYLDEAAARILAEWRALYEAGIVEQKPPATPVVGGGE